MERRNLLKGIVACFVVPGSIIKGILKEPKREHFTWNQRHPNPDIPTISFGIQKVPLPLATARKITAKWTLYRDDSVLMHNGEALMKEIDEINQGLYSTRM